MNKKYLMKLAAAVCCAMTMAVQTACSSIDNPSDPTHGDDGTIVGNWYSDVSGKGALHTERVPDASILLHRRLQDESPGIRRAQQLLRRLREVRLPQADGLGQLAQHQHATSQQEP